MTKQHSKQKPPRHRVDRTRKRVGGITLPVPATAHDPVPTAVVVEKYADGTARAVGPRSAMSYRRMEDFVNRVFGQERAFKPSAHGRHWFAFIKPETPTEEVA